MILRNREESLKRTTENKQPLSAMTLYNLKEKIKQKEEQGYKLRGEIIQQRNGWWACLMVKEIKFRGRD